ncbi:MAG: acyl--CoA ligase [Burkholderiaceae bacterium]|nr:acyl--CoA ligase [Burkholderiaceae bacterium]
MIGLNLDAILKGLPPSRTCLVNGKAHITIEEVLAMAWALRAGMPEAKGARVALCGLAPLDLVLALVALDGHAEQILLFPGSLDSATLDGLNAQAGTTHILTSGDRFCRPIGTRMPGQSTPAPTNWLLATSGTTGTPKLIAHQLATLTRTVRADPDRGANFMWGLLYDPNRFAGLQVVLQALYSGSALVISERIEFSAQLAAILDNPVNALSATPTLWRKLLMDGRISKLPLRQLTLGGEISDQAILDALKSQFPKARVVHIYASTEAGAGFAVKDGRAGFPAAWIENTGFSPALRINAAQHLLIKPPLLPTGPEIIARLDSDGYLDTQDIVRFDNDRIFFMGRASGAINVGGNKVSPESLESYLRNLDGVIDARVFAKKSSMTGQLVAAEIVLEAGSDVKVMRQHIIQSCKRNLESWEVPALISFVNELRENAAGKRERLTT